VTALNAVAPTTSVVYCGTPLRAIAWSKYCGAHCPSTLTPLMKNVGVELTWNLASSAMSVSRIALHSALSMSVLSRAVSSPMSLESAMILSTPSLDVSRADAYGAKALSQNAFLNATNAGPSTSSAMPIDVGASSPSGIAVTSSRPARRASRTAIAV